MCYIIVVHSWADGTMALRSKHIMAMGLSAFLGACYDPAMAPPPLPIISPSPAPVAPIVQNVPVGYYLGTVVEAHLTSPSAAAGQPALPPVMEYTVLLDRGPSVAVSQLMRPNDPALQPGARAVVRTLDGHVIVLAAGAIPPSVDARLATSMQAPLDLGYATIFDQPGYQCIGIGIDSTCHRVTGGWTQPPSTIPMFPRG